MPFLGRPVEWFVSALRLSDLPVRINLGDLFTVYARKPQ